MNWSFADPSAFNGTDAERLIKTIVVREEIRAKVRQWAAATLAQVPSPGPRGEG